MVWKSVPVSTPASVANPALRPPPSECARMMIVFGPGTKTSTMTASTKPNNARQGIASTRASIDKRRRQMAPAARRHGHAREVRLQPFAEMSRGRQPRGVYVRERRECPADREHVL